MIFETPTVYEQQMYDKELCSMIVHQNHIIFKCVNLLIRAYTNILKKY